MAGLDPGAEESKRPRRGQRLPPRTAARRAAARTFACRRSGCSPRSECQSRQRERLRRAAEAQSQLANVWNEKITRQAFTPDSPHARHPPHPMRRSRPVALPVFRARVPRAVNVVMPKIPLAAGFDRLTTPGRTATSRPQPAAPAERAAPDAPPRSRAEKSKAAETSPKPCRVHGKAAMLPNQAAAA